MEPSWQTILSIATRAPSPHNVQPWRLRLHDAAHATLFFERRLMLPYTDQTGSFMLSAIGTLLEAIAIVAANHGLALETTLLPPDETAAREPFAELYLRPAAVTPSYPDTLFLTRRTARRPLLPGAVPAAAVAALGALAAAWDQRYSHIADPVQIARLLRRNAATLVADLNDPRYHAELAPWLRPGRRATLQTRDGLDARCLAVRPAELLAIKRAPGLLVAPLVGPALQARYERTLGGAPAIGAIGGPFWDRAAAVRAGRMLLRFWLETARHGLAIHPLGNLITNATARAAVAAELGHADSWLLFKIGGAPDAPLSLRKSLEEIML